MMRALVWGCLFSSGLFTSAWSAPFKYPLDYPVQVSSTFGTHRITHHHAGLDLTTDGKETVPVIASADGKVVRIRRHPKGYGRSVYVVHPGGFMTVYAHLSAFGPQLMKPMSRLPKLRSRFKFNLYLNKPIPVKAGDLLGWVGTSGTDLVHLHFELRKNGRPINPLRNGMDITDTQPPRVNRILFRPLDGKAHINDANEEFLWTVIPGKKLSVSLAGRVGVLAEMIDHIDGGHRKLVPYSFHFSIDGRPVHRTIYDTVNYAHKGHTERDYDARLKAHKVGIFHRLFQVDKLKLPVQRPGGKTLDFLKPGQHTGRIVVQDAVEQVGDVEFDLNVRPQKPPCSARFASFKAVPRKKKRNALPLIGRRLFIFLEPHECDGGHLDVDVRFNGRRSRDWTVSRRTGKPVIVIDVSPTQNQDIDVGIQSADGSRRWIHTRTAAGLDGETIRLKPLTFKFGKGARFGAYPMAVYPGKHPGSKGLEAVSPLFRMANGWARAGGPGRVTLAVPPDTNRDRLALFLHDDGRWWYLGQKVKDGRIAGRSVHMTGFSLMRDLTKPKIDLPKIEPHPAGPRIVWPLSDMGSGIRKIQMRINGEPVAFEWQRAFSRVLYLPLNQLEDRRHIFELDATDRLGNQAKAKIEVCWPTGSRPPCPK